MGNGKGKGIVKQTPGEMISPVPLLFSCRRKCMIGVLIEFCIYARYKSHDDATLIFMEDALHSFHSFKDVILLVRAAIKAKAKANALRTELVKKRTVDKETNAETWMPSKTRHDMKA